jgi:ABC-type multidrug transport system ATPase subunit
MTAMLEVEGIQKRLGRRKVLHGVSLACAANEIVVLLGENGAGKSTLLRIIAGVLPPDAGEVRLDGASILGRHVAGRKRLGYVPEAAEPLPQLTGGELVALVAALKACAPPPAELVDRLGVRGTLEQRIGSMSLGQRRRLCLLAALVGDPAVLILDEPTNGLDPDGVAMLLALLEERRAAGATILLATHDLDFVGGVSGRIVRLKDGALA